MGAIGGVVLQYEPTAPPDLFAEWLVERGVPFEVRRVWEQGPPPDLRELAWVCALGSDSTPGQPDPPEWMEEELAFLGRALSEDVPILGLCFGGQALAAAAGAAIHPADPPEVGWFEIESAEVGLIPVGPWLHFHYDQLELPAGAVELARSPAGVAAFSLDRSLGLQFHPEVTTDLANSWAEAERERIEPLGFSVETIAADGERAGRAAAVAARRLFDGWLREAGIAGAPAVDEGHTQL